MMRRQRRVVDFTTTVPRRMSSLLLVVSLLSICIGVDADGTPSTTSWILELGNTPTVAGQLSSSASIGKMTFLFGGLSADVLPVTQNTTLQQLLTQSRPTSTSVNFVDTNSKNIGTPLTLSSRFVREGLPWVNISTNVTREAMAWVGVTLPTPTIGLNNAVVIGSVVYHLAMCNVVPAGTVVDGDASGKDAAYLRSGWKATLEFPFNGANNGDVYAPSIPKLRMETFALSLADAPNPRYNASCVAHGSNIYIVGGAQLPSGAVTSFVAVYDTVSGRYSDSVWDHQEAVTNPGVASDDAFVYIVGGQLAGGGTSLSVFAHHMPSNSRVFESAYPTPEYNMPFVAISSGNILVTGSPFGTIAVWSMRLKSGFPVTKPSSSPGLIHGSLGAFTNDRNITLALFGGVLPNAGINTNYYECVVSLGNSLWNIDSNPDASASLQPLGVRYFWNNGSDSISPDWIPNNNGSITARISGFAVFWDLLDFSVLFDAASLLSICNISSSDVYTGPRCSLRIARSPRCDDPFVADVVLTNNTVIMTSSSTWAAVGPFQPITNRDPDSAASGSSHSASEGSGSATPPPIMDRDISDRHWETYESKMSFRAPSFVSVCISVAPFEVPGCVGGSPDGLGGTDCSAYFYTSLNQLTPFILNSSSSLHPPAPPVPTSAPVSNSNTQRLAMYVGISVGCLALLAGAGVVVWQRNASSSNWPDGDDEGDDAEDGEKSLLFDRKKRRSTGGTAPTATAQQGHQPALLDGKYRVLQRLGKGSFSVVYLVERVADGQLFALKYVQIADDTDRHEAMKECEVVHKLQGHPNVIQLYDMFMSYRFDTNLGVDGAGGGSPGVGSSKSNQSPRYFDTSLFAVRMDDDTTRESASAARPQRNSGERYLSLVMQFHERGDLGRWVRRLKGEPRIPEATILSIAFQVLSVLNYMHHGTPPIIHRDLKPENILLQSIVYENMSHTFLPIVVTDFGLSRVMDKTFCETGVGSLPYVAPECWQRCYSTKVDIWAVGCILYAVCAKRVEPDNVRVMFSESSRPDFHKKLFSELHHVFGYSEGCANFIISLLEVDAQMRPTAATALKRLKKRRAASSAASSSLPTSFNRNTLLMAAQRQTSELDPDSALEKQYDSSDMGNDAQCEFYVAADTVFSTLSSGWSSVTNSYADRAGGPGLRSGPLPPRPPVVQSVQSHRSSVRGTASVTSSRELPVPSMSSSSGSGDALRPVAAAESDGPAEVSSATTGSNGALLASVDSVNAESSVDRQHAREELYASSHSMLQLNSARDAPEEQ